MNKDEKSLRILLDSDSLKSESAKGLINYPDNDIFEFVSLGYSKHHVMAQLLFNDKSETNRIVIDKSNRASVYKENTLFGYKISDIKEIAKSTDIKYDDLLLVYILKTFLNVSKGKKIILVTERKKLFNRLYWKKSGFPELPVYSILKPDEAKIFIDLYCKNSNKFIIAPSCYVNKGLWYLYSLKTKVPNYQKIWSVIIFGGHDIPLRVDLEENVDSLGDRIIDMLVAIDEIGANYYSGVDNDIKDAIIYHFNYFITLFTGVFDSLAWISKYRYQIKFDLIERMGLRINKQKEFLKLLFKTNYKIKNFLGKNSSLINLMYSPRNLVIHRKRLKGLHVNNVDDNYDLNIIRIPEDFFVQIVGLSREKGKNLGEWGHFSLDDNYFLEPYRFVKKITPILFDFVNEYLDLLDFDEYVRTKPSLKKRLEENSASSSYKNFEKELDIFNKYRLGY
jgi:hypothetical protein